MRDGSLRAPGDDDRLPLQALGGVDGGERDAARHGSVLRGGSPIEILDQAGEIPSLLTVRRGEVDDRGQ